MIQLKADPRWSLAIRQSWYSRNYFSVQDSCMALENISLWASITLLVKWE